MALNYETTNWENGKTVLRAEHLRKIEKGITDIIAENDAIYKDEDTRKSNEVDRNRKVNETISKMESISSSIQTNIANKVKEVDNKLNNKISEADNKILDIEDRFLYLTSSQQQSAEVLDARLGLDGTRYTSLKERIDSIETSPYILFEEVEG